MDKHKDQAQPASQGERNTDISDSGRGGNSRTGTTSSSDEVRGRGSEDSGGITNRSLEEEMEEQDRLPDRGSSQSER